VNRRELVIGIHDATPGGDRPVVVRQSQPDGQTLEFGVERIYDDGDVLVVQAAPRPNSLDSTAD
jgi:hypothetical protein